MSSSPLPQTDCLIKYVLSVQMSCCHGKTDCFNPRDTHRHMTNSSNGLPGDLTDSSFGMFWKSRQCICCMVGGSTSIFDVEGIRHQSSQPPVSSIQPCGRQDIGQRVVVCPDGKLAAIEVIVELLSNTPLQRKELQFMCWIIPF